MSPDHNLAHLFALSGDEMGLIYVNFHLRSGHYHIMMGTHSCQDATYRQQHEPGVMMTNPGAPVLRFQFEGEVWMYRNPATLYFISLPKEMSDDILDLVGTSLNPWGTVPVDVTIGDVTWASSMFPRKDRGCYDLPLNARARRRTGLDAGAIVNVTIEIPLPV